MRKVPGFGSTCFVGSLLHEKLGFDRSCEITFSPFQRTAFARSCLPRLINSRVDGTWNGGRSAADTNSCKSGKSFKSSGNTETGLEAKFFVLSLPLEKQLLYWTEESRECGEIEHSKR